MSKPTRIAWIDLETTCSDENQRHSAILEYGAVFTDFYLEPIMKTTIVFNPGLDPAYQGYIDEYDLPGRLTPEETLEGIWSRMDPVVQDMHTKNGLWDEVAKSDFTHEKADDVLRQFYEELGEGNKLVLAGSGVGHFDSRWLRKFLPKSSELLTYYTYDVGVVRRFLRDLAKVEVDVADPNGASSGDAKTHRAADDAHAHLREARVYVDSFRGHVL